MTQFPDDFGREPGVDRRNRFVKSLPYRYVGVKPVKGNAR